MLSSFPFLLDKYKVCIVCEGHEEIDYLNRLLDLNLFYNIYEIELENAESNGNIIPLYIDRYNSDFYDIALIFCDTNRRQDDYLMIKNKLKEFHGIDLAHEIIFFGNPCTMQIILSHFDKVSLKTQSKKVNSDLIESLTRVSNYKAKNN